VFVQGKREFYRKNYYVQNILIKALSEGVTEPEELRKIAHLDKVADVYRSLDKLAIRREYHDALARNGISLDYIVDNIKELAEGAKSDSTKLKSLEILLRSLGLEKYEESEVGGKGWEDIIIEAEEKKASDVKSKRLDVSDYTVITPETPEKEKKTRERERAMGKELYEEQ